MSDPDDRRNSIVSINAGAGGTESQDWVEMLYRMYLRWCESKGYKTEVIDYMPAMRQG
jgi:peptide chain release factor 2